MLRLTKIIFIIPLLMALICAPNRLVAEEDPEEETVLEPIMYYEIRPNILTFYQGTGRKIGYVVVQVNIAVRGQESYDLVELHLPLIQDALIDFFNKQHKSVIQPIAERESLRQKAKARVSQLLKQETQKDVVENLLFTNYVYQ